MRIPLGQARCSCPTPFLTTPQSSPLASSRLTSAFPPGAAEGQLSGGGENRSTALSGRRSWSPRPVMVRDPKAREQVWGACEQGGGATLGGGGVPGLEFPFGIWFSLPWPRFRLLGRCSSADGGQPGCLWLCPCPRDRGQLGALRALSTAPICSSPAVQGCPHISPFPTCSLSLWGLWEKLFSRCLLTLKWIQGHLKNLVFPRHSPP